MKPFGEWEREEKWRGKQREKKSNVRYLQPGFGTAEEGRGKLRARMTGKEEGERAEPTVTS